MDRREGVCRASASRPTPCEARGSPTSIRLGSTLLRIQALGRVFELSRTPTGWNSSGREPGKADPEAVQALILGLAQLQASAFLDEAKWTNPGLDPPVMTVQVWQGPPRSGSPAAPGRAEGEPRLDLASAATMC